MSTWETSSTVATDYKNGLHFTSSFFRRQCFVIPNEVTVLSTFKLFWMNVIIRSLIGSNNFVGIILGKNNVYWILFMVRDFAHLRYVVLYRIIFIPWLIWNCLWDCVYVFQWSTNNIISDQWINLSIFLFIGF